MSEILQRTGADLKPFNAVPDGDWLLARTGYTGEDGFEIMLPGDRAASFWRRLSDAGVEPCGLGARDTLRLEAGMNLYGSDMDETISPLESGLGWTVAWEPADRDFIGRRVRVGNRPHIELVDVVEVDGDCGRIGKWRGAGVSYLDSQVEIASEEFSRKSVKCVSRSMCILQIKTSRAVRCSAYYPGH